MDPHTVEVPDGRQFRGGTFILCAGGRARRLDFPGEELALTHSDIWRLQKLPRSVAIVGGAATGCQLATIFNAFGSEVTVLDVAPRILTIEDSLVSQAMGEAFREAQHRRHHQHRRAGAHRPPGERPGTDLQTG